MPFFNVSGLAVASEIELPWRSTEAVAAPDVTIRQGRIPFELPDAVEVGPTWWIAGDRFLIRIPGVARFLLSQGQEVTFEIEQGAATEDVAVFVIGTVFGILLHQRRQIVLHASAVRVGDKAVLFCGPSGAGKSTMAAALNKRGHALLTDDVCAIDTDALGTLVARSDGRRLKLWEQAIRGLDLSQQKAGAVRSHLAKFYVDPREPTNETLPIGAVYVLRELRAPYTAGIERPNLVDAALFIRRNAYRPKLVAAMGQTDRYFRSAAAIAAGPGVFLLTLPRAFAALPKVIEGLGRHWAEIGLVEAAA